MFPKRQWGQSFTMETTIKIQLAHKIIAVFPFPQLCFRVKFYKHWLVCLKDINIKSVHGNPGGRVDKL